MIHKLSYITVAVLGVMGWLAADPIPQPQIIFTASRTSSGVTWTADWEGVAARTYFMQWSADLVTWSYFPTINFGTGIKSQGGMNSAPKHFMRLVGADYEWVHSLGEAELADFDGDGIPNLFEVVTLGTNPFEKASNGGDLNGNGIPDGYELYHFGALGVSGLSDDPDNDGLVNQVELMLGMNASAAFESGNSTNWEIYLPN